MIDRLRILFQKHVLPVCAVMAGKIHAAVWRMRGADEHNGLSVNVVTAGSTAGNTIPQ